MKLDDQITQLRDDALQAGEPPVLDTLQGVTKKRVKAVLEVIDLATDDQVDVVFALLDDRSSWFSKKKYPGKKFYEGATTAHLGCHVGILQRGKTKLDREFRDYGIKPFREIGAIEAILLDMDSGEFVSGHGVSKSGNSCYRLDADFKLILQAQDDEWEAMLTAWVVGDRVRERLELQARLAKESRARIETKHSDLIAASKEHYAPRFLVGYEVVYVDDGDGDRITDEQRESLAKAGLTYELGDPMPDVLLWNSEDDSLWVIEAVTSDGEVDNHKVTSMKSFAERNGKSDVGFTTTYQTWKAAAARQGKHKNLAIGTYLWILEDPGRQLKVI